MVSFVSKTIHGREVWVIIKVRCFAANLVVKMRTRIQSYLRVNPAAKRTLNDYFLGKWQMGLAIFLKISDITVRVKIGLL